MSSTVFRYQGGRKFIVASKQGRGFIVAEDECLANTRKGKQVLNVKPPDAARALAPSRANWSPPSARTARWWCSRSSRCRK